jgi:hypothetical protein
LIDFLNDELSLNIKTEIINSTPVSQRIRKFLGKTIGKLVSQLYAIVREEAHRNRTYTYEISYSSKAYKIFMAKEFTFDNEKIAQREALIYLLRKKFKGTIQNILDSIPSISIERFNTNKYIKTLFEYERDRQVLGEIEYLYEEEKPDMSRIETLLLLGSDTNFDYIDDYVEEE